nr:hypothetical protein JVH1_4576 [Rhodococcus sp. JVH1]
MNAANMIRTEGNSAELSSAASRRGLTAVVRTDHPPTQR